MSKRLLFAGGLVAAAVLTALGFLTARVLGTIRVEARERSRAELRAAASRAAATARGRIAAIVDVRLSAEDAWRISPEGTFRAPPEPIPFEPERPPLDAPAELVFFLAEGERAEIRDDDPETAAGFYRAASGEAAPPALRRIALARLAALEGKRGNAAEARRLWTMVAEIAGDTELLPAAAAEGAPVDESRLVRCLVRHLRARPRGVAAGYARLLGLFDRPEIVRRRRELRRMDLLHPHLLPAPPAGEVRATPLPGGAMAFRRGMRAAVLEAADLREVLGPAAVLPDEAGAPPPGDPLSIVVPGDGPLRDVLFVARADPEGIERAVRRQATLVLLEVAIAGAVVLVGLAVLLVGVRRATELARLKAEFVTNVSHDLRAPLALIRLYAETMRSGLVPAGEEQEYARVMEREAVALSGLVDRVLDFARIDRGMREYRLVPGDLASLARELAATAEARWPGLTLTAEIPDGPLPAHFDAGAIAGAVGNLLENAVRYAGGRALFCLRREEGYAILEVLDRGPGLPAREAERLFERFRRGRAAEGWTARGSGLGLALVRHTARSHGGEAEFAPREGGGSVFRIRLPAGGEESG